MPAFDPELHEIDPISGFQVDKKTGHKVGLETAPHKAPEGASSDWPRWVKVHASHVTRRKMGDAPEHVSVAAFPQHHVDRATGEVTVLVNDEAEAAKAEAEYVAPESAEDRAKREASEAAEAQRLADERATDAKAAIAKGSVA